jgi:hypothetical protein
MKNNNLKTSRLYTNIEIQEKLALQIQKLEIEEIEIFCDKAYSKSIFDLNFSLLLKVPQHFTLAEKRAAVKDHTGLNRWTWKFEFQKSKFAYAITTQWYPWNDVYVEQWLRKQNNQ